MTDASNDKKWFFVNHRGAQHGPSNLSHLTWCAERGYLLPTSLVWTKGQAEWLPAEQALPRDVFDGIDLPPPLPEPVQAPEQPEQTPVVEQAPRAYRLLYKILKNAKANVREFPARATQSGFQITRHRKPTTSTDIYEGEITLGTTRAKVNVIVGIKPVIGGIIKMTISHPPMEPSDLKLLTDEAEAWFKKHWAGEERVWPLVVVMIFQVLFIVLMLAGTWWQIASRIG